MQKDRIKVISIMNKMALAVVLLMVMIGFLNSCADEISFKPTKDKDKEEPKQEAVAVAEESTAQLQEDYVYTSVGKRDPFRSVFDEMGVDAEDLGGEIPTSPLQEYEASSFELAGIVWGVASPVAMVIAPDGQSYIVKVGTLMGQNWGKVTKIMRDRIIITEVSRNPSGPKIINQIEVKLRVEELKTGLSGYGYETIEKALEEDETETAE